LLSIALYFMVSRRARVIAVPVTLALVALVTLVGPWSAYAVSRRSQQGRLDILLARHGLWREGRIERASSPVSWDDRRDISRLLDYLSEFHGPTALSRWFAGSPNLLDAGQPSHPNRPERLMAEIGLSYVGRSGSVRIVHFERHGRRDAVAVA